jgi:hypothetical protein
MASNITIKALGLPSDLAEYFTGLLMRKISARTEVTFSTLSEDSLSIQLRLDPAIPEDGFRISDGAAGEIRIEGANRRGLIYAIGKFLRTAVFEDDSGKGIHPGAWRGLSIPVKPVRGMYFATHFHNFYHRAPVEEVEKYVEDLALWGYNAVTVWFDMHHFRSIQDPEAQELISRLHAVLNAAYNIGLKPGLLVLGNEAYADSPEDLRAEWRGGQNGYFSDLPMYRLELCPNKPAAYDLLLHWRREVFEAFADIPMEFVWIWPYDQGGCGCADCAPWGGNGFLKIARPVAQMARHYFPNAKLVLSTWYFDCYTAGEFEVFARQMQNDTGWVDYLLAEYPGKYPEYILEHGTPGGLPLIGFPEISMFQSGPWGGYGANPLPEYLSRMWAEAGERLSGGFPYSEGIFEDINKVIIAQYYWQGQGKPEDAILEYANLYFSSLLKVEITRAAQILETTNCRERLQNGQAEWIPHSPDATGVEQFVIAHPEGVDQAYGILKEVDGKLPRHLRDSWRWRILLLRGMIDHELAHNNFQSTDACEAAFEELIRIYHAEDAIWAVRPPARRNRVVDWG